LLNYFVNIQRIDDELFKSWEKKFANTTV
jgi:hypothetical protein